MAESGHCIRLWPGRQASVTAAPADKTEHTCKLINVSVGGAALQTEETLELGEHIIAYFDEIGRIDGPVVEGPGPLAQRGPNGTSQRASWKAVASARANRSR